MLAASTNYSYFQSVKSHECLRNSEFLDFQIFKLILKSFERKRCNVYCITSSTRYTLSYLLALLFLELFLYYIISCINLKFAVFFHQFLESFVLIISTKRGGELMTMTYRERQNQRHSRRQTHLGKRRY